MYCYKYKFISVSIRYVALKKIFLNFLFFNFSRQFNKILKCLFLFIETFLLMYCEKLENTMKISVKNS